MAEWEPEPLVPAAEVALSEEPAEPAPAAAEPAEDQTYRIVQFPREAEPATPPAPEPGDVRKSELAVAGLY